MNGFVANTHSDWFDFLARQLQWEEVNFWNPSDYYAFRGAPGSPFFFRLMAPRSAIGGFGIVSRFDKLPEWLAWECFGPANGAATFQEMQNRLNLIRQKNRMAAKGDLQRIGCIILSGACFFPEELWIRQPTDWGPQNLRYKTYDLSAGEGLRLWRECSERADLLQGSRPLPLLARDGAARFAAPAIIQPRLGQGAFRLAITDAYRRSCAVTGEHSLPALEAAHIQPYSDGGPHAVNNGLLLRSDLHRLFDRGYVTVTSDNRLEVSHRLKEDYQNGRSYYPLHGSQISVPVAVGDRPDPVRLHWHNEHIFLG